MMRPVSRLRTGTEVSGEVPDTRELIDGLRRFDRLVELHASSFYARHRDELERILATPLGGGPAHAPAAVPRTLRCVQWNIEKGLRYEGIARALRTHPVLSAADVVMLNEVDLGMARSGNRHIARELAAQLDMHWAFAPAHIEMTKGVGAELDAEGENAVGMQGNAILSRYPLAGVRVVRLACCFEPYHFHEKRYGGRVAISAHIDTAAGPMQIVGTHLEVRNTPGCRARQMRDITRITGRRGRALVGGDLNCSTFERGTFLRTLAGTARLVGDVDRLFADLRDPRAREPLFLELRRAGLRVEGWNTDDVTIVERIDALEDARLLPGFLVKALRRRIDRMGSKLPMRLDWFAGREIEGRNPQTLRDIAGDDGQRVSDHDPISVDVVSAG